MRIISFAIKQKQSAELRRNSSGNSRTLLNIKSLLRDELGGGLGILFIGISIIAFLLVIFLNIADYSIFTYKRNEISRALDYAVTAAVQQIKTNESIEGLAEGFSDNSGKKMLENIQINMDKAEITFTDILNRNSNISEIYVNRKLLLCSTYVDKGMVKYKIKATGYPTEYGETESPQDLEGIINNAMEAYWPSGHKTSIYVNGNPYTNMFEKGTYLLAVLKEVEITGIFSKRKVNLSSFAGAKIERLVD